jgi:hypothetical protein
MGLYDRVPAVCSAIDAKAFQTDNNIVLESRTGPMACPVLNPDFLLLSICSAGPIRPRALANRRVIFTFIRVKGLPEGANSTEFPNANPWNSNMTQSGSSSKAS